MTINVTKKAGKVINKIPKQTILYLFFAGLICFGLAFTPILALTDENYLLDRFIQSFNIVLQETSNQPGELIAIFWLPFVVSISYLITIFLALLVSGKLITKIVIAAPLVATIGALGYFFVVQNDIHILSISLLPLAGAYWEYYKNSKASPL